MLFDFNSFYSTRRNLLLSNFIFFLSLSSLEKISILNLYFFKIDMSILPINLIDIIFIVIIYFFIVYYSFLINNENNAIEIFKKTYFFKFRKNKNNIFIMILYPLLTPAFFIVDSLRVKNFAIILTPYIITFISIYIYIYQKIPDFNIMIAMIIFGGLPIIYKYFLDILELKYEKDKNEISIKKIKYNLNEKYRINKENILSKRK